MSLIKDLKYPSPSVIEAMDARMRSQRLEIGGFRVLGSRKWIDPEQEAEVKGQAFWLMG